MTTLAEIRDALGARLQTLGLTEARSDQTAQPTPYFLATLGDLDYHATFSVTEGPWASSAGAFLVFDVAIYVGAQLYAEAELALMEFAENSGDKSVRACIEDGPTLGLTGVDAKVMGSRPGALEEVDAQGRIPRIFTIHIAARKGQA